MSSLQPTTQNIFKKLAANLAQKVWGWSTPAIPLGTQSTIVGGGIVTWAGQNAQGLVNDGYRKNDIVYSCVRLISDKVKVAPWAEYSVKDEQAYKMYKAATISKKTDLKELVAMHRKALEPIKNTSKLTDLLTYPNDDDTFADLIEQWASYKLITGNTYIAADLIGAGKNSGIPQRLFSLPSQYVQIIADINKFPAKATAYQLYMGFYQAFTREEVLHDKYFNPEANINGIQLYGMSPLSAAAMVLTRSNEGKQAAVSNYQNGGPKSIVFMNANDKVPPMIIDGQADAIKKRLDQYQGSRQVNQATVSGYPVGVAMLGLTPVELDLLRAEGFDIRAICNIYGVPSQLLNDPENKIQANATEAEKTLTTRCAIPMLNDIEKNLNRKFQSAWGFKGQNRVVAYDPQVYLELQEQRSQQVDWLAKAWWIPVEKKYDIMSMDLPADMPDEIRNGYFTASGTMIDGTGEITLPNDLNPYNKDQNETD